MISGRESRNKDPAERVAIKDDIRKGAIKTQTERVTMNYDIRPRESH